MSGASDEEEVRKLVGAARLAYYTPVHQHPPLADRKASFLLTASGVIVTVLLIFSGAIERMVRSPYWLASFLVLVLLFALLGAMAIAAWFAWRAFGLRIPPMPTSHAFFNDISRESFDEYSRKLKRIEHRQAIREMLHYNYSLATQAAIKFRLVNRAFACFRVVIVLWLFLLLMISLAG
jgi:hypothetical protein